MFMLSLGMADSYGIALFLKKKFFFVICIVHLRI